MARKQLNDIVNTLPQMVAGRLDAADYEALADLPDGVLTIDLLARTAAHESGAAPAISATGLLADWFEARLTVAKLARSDVVKAAITVAITTSSLPFDRSRLVPFRFLSTAEIATPDRVFASKPASAMRWFRRHDGMILD